MARVVVVGVGVPRPDPTKSAGGRRSSPCRPGSAGCSGSWLLLSTDQRWFDAIVPWLILFACALVALQGPIARWVAERRGDGDGVSPMMWLAQLGVSVYGGYFGAGMGIVMLATMGILLPSSLQHANGLKLACAVVINGVAAFWFLVTGAASLPHAAFMAVASIAGGWVGAKVAKQMPASALRIRGRGLWGVRRRRPPLPVTVGPREPDQPSTGVVP